MEQAKMARVESTRLGFDGDESLRHVDLGLGGVAPPALLLTSIKARVDGVNLRGQPPHLQ